MPKEKTELDLVFLCSVSSITLVKYYSRTDATYFLVLKHFVNIILELGFSVSSRILSLLVSYLLAFWVLTSTFITKCCLKSSYFSTMYSIVTALLMCIKESGPFLVFLA